MTPLEFKSWWHDHQNSFRDYLMSTLCQQDTPTKVKPVTSKLDYTTVPQLRQWLNLNHNQLLLELGQDEFSYSELKAYVRRNYKRKPGDEVVTKPSLNRSCSSRWEDTLSNVVSGKSPSSMPKQFIQCRRNWYRINPLFALHY